MLHPTIPEAKPAFELIDDRLCQKVSPKYDHARMQGTLVGLLTAWAKGRGRVGTEWRFSFEVSGEFISLVPDVAYLSYARLPRELRHAAQEPEMAPDVAVEVRSPSDWKQQVERKAVLYLAAGTMLVVEVDPQRRRVTLHDVGGATIYDESAIVEHPVLPGFRLDVRALFAELDD